MISTFPPPWNFTLTWNVHKGPMMSTSPPMEIQIDLDFPRGSDDIKIPTPMVLQIDLECQQGKDDIKIPTARGTSH